MTQFSVNSLILTRTSAFIAAILLGLASFRAAGLLQQEQSSLQSSINAPLSQPAGKSKRGKINYSLLAKLHIFGEVSKQSDTPLKRETLDAPETNLKLELIGVLFNRDTDDGLAIISESGKSQKNFHKGEKLPGGATLYAIEKERIILQRNGRHETLTLKKPSLQSKEPSRRNNRPTLSRQPPPHIPLVKRTTKYM